MREFGNKLNLAKDRMYSNYAFYFGATPDNSSDLAKLKGLDGCCGVKLFAGSSTGNILVDKEYDSKSFFVGATIGHGDLLRPNITQLFLSEFTYLTPANSFKQTAIHPRPGVWNWKKYDDFIDFAEKNN